MSNDKMLQKLLIRVREDEDVLAAFLFGSAVREEQTHSSDVDLCLVLEPKSLPFELGPLSHKRLDYSKDFSFDEERYSLVEQIRRSSRAD